MNHPMFKLSAVFLAFVLAFVMPFAAIQAAPPLQDATPTPAPEEEAETEAAMEDADAEEADAEETEEAEMAGAEDLQLVTARVAADLVQPGRVLMSARGNHWVYDSVPPLNGPNEEVNPLDGMLTALIACGMYIYEAVGIEEGITTDNLSATVTGQLDGRGVAGAAVNPRVRAFDVTMNVDGPTAEEAAMMAEAFSQRCPIYTTLALSAPISVTNVVDGEAQETIATDADPIVDHDIPGEELELGMPSASGRMIEFGRSVMSARGNHWIFDSVPPINGPNEEVNPLDALVGALPACGIMVYEAVAREQDIALHSVNATVEADLDPRGVAGAPVNPRIRAFRVTMNVDGPTEEEAAMMAEQYSQRCPIYTTFERSAPIEVTNHIMGEGTAVLDVTFTYDFDSAEEYIAEVSPLAE
ncbi:MAG: OsmC family protein, partial [Caldilineaceae bacterium]|nr:OsmC family protein [Caldilineaceae bacterium]